MSTSDRMKLNSKMKTSSDDKKDAKTKSRSKNFPPTCFHCQYVGHIKKWCPFLMGTNRTDAVPSQSKTGTVSKTEKVETQENSKG